jgi:hypothetical protein
LPPGTVLVGHLSQARGLDDLRPGADCDAPQPTSIAGVKVSAFDVDWTQDDPLGSGITDATGYFHISVSTFSPSTSCARRCPFSTSR